MKALRFSRAARTHLLSIGQYTQETWGIKQRDIYLKKLFRCFGKLCRSPLSGKTRNELFAGMRSVHVQKHVVYYYIGDDEILIAGVLHERMDPARHLPSV